MGPVSDAAAQILKALDSLGLGRATTDPAGALSNLPALVLGAPQLAWETSYAAPTSATFVVYIVVAADELAVERLWDLVTDVSAAVDAQTDGVVTRADPGVYQNGTVQLPCYEIQVEVGL